jgi:predicted Zn-dependent protease
MLLMRAARWPEAAAHLEQLVALQPGRQLPRYRLAIARLAAGDCAAAAATIRQAWEMNRNEGSVLLALVRILAVCPARPADSELALAEARRLAAAVQSAAVREALAMALAANGEFVQAQEIQAALVAAGNENRQRPERVDNLSRYRAGQPARRAWPAGAEVFHPGLASATDQ